MKQKIITDKDAVDSQRQLDAMQWICPVCGAPPQALCVGTDGIHQQREMSIGVNEFSSDIEAFDAYFGGVLDQLDDKIREQIIERGQAYTKFLRDEQRVTEAENAAEALKAKIDEAVEAAKVAAVMPSVGQAIWCICLDGTLACLAWNRSNHFLGLWAMGNIFLTKADCKAEIERRKALQRVRQWVSANTESFEPDWNNEYQNKWHISYDYITKRLLWFSINTMKYVNTFMCFATASDAERCIAECEADLKVLAGVE